MKKSLLVWLLFTAVFSLIWVPAYVYAKQNVQDKLSNYRSVDAREKKLRAAYLEDWRKFSKERYVQEMAWQKAQEEKPPLGKYSEAMIKWKDYYQNQPYEVNEEQALTRAAALAEIPVSRLTGNELALHAASKAWLDSRTAFENAEKTWSEASRLLVAVQWAGGVFLLISVVYLVFCLGRGKVKAGDIVVR